MLGAGVWFFGSARRLSQEKLDAMQSAFAFLVGDFGMRCVRRVDQGIGAEVRFEDDETALSVWYDKGYYSVTVERRDDPRYVFDIDQLRTTAAASSQDKTVADLGARIRPDYAYLRAALRSERADAIVREREHAIVQNNRKVLEDEPR